VRPDLVPDFEQLRNHCNELVANIIASATDEDRAEILKVAEMLIAKAEALSRK
jgi:hypothetical protein